MQSSIMCECVCEIYRYAGEPELLLLASILHMPIAVYVYAPHAVSMDSGPFRQIQVSILPCLSVVS